MFFLFFLLFPFFNLFAFTGAPEWATYVRQTLTIEDQASYIDSEYISDQLAYSHDVDQEYVWQSGSNVADFVFGSLSSNKFYHQSRVKIQSDLSDRWRFSYIQFSQDDYERNQSSTWLSLSHRYNSNFGFAISATPESDKSEIDYKAQFNLFFKDSKISIYYIEPKLMKNSKSEDDSVFYNKKPRAYGLKWFAGDKNNFFVFQTRIDTSSELRIKNSFFNSSNYLHQLVLKHTNDDYIFNFKSEISKAYEQLTDSLISLSASQKGSEVLLSFEHNQPNTLGAGFMYKQLDWKTDRGELLHKNYLPFIYYKLTKNAWAYQLTWESTLHKSKTIDQFEVSNTDCESCYEHRLNIALKKVFKPSFSFQLKLTVDVDEFGSDNTWEGGSGQFYLKF